MCSSQSKKVFFPGSPILASLLFGILLLENYIIELRKTVTGNWDNKRNLLELQRVPALRAFWDLEKTVLHEIGVSLAGHILDALRRNNETGVINSEFCIRL